MKNGITDIIEENKLNTIFHTATIVETTSDAIFSSNLDRHILSWNPGAEKLFGYSAQEILGKSSDLLVPEDRIKEAKLLFNSVMKDKKLINFETLRLRKDGTEIPVSVANSPIKDSKGKIIGFSATYRDISVKKRHELELLQSQRLLEGLFLSIEDGLVIIDTDYRVIKYNAPIAKWYSFKKDVTGKKCYELFYRRSNPCSECPYFDTLTTGDQTHRITTVTLPDGKEYTFEKSYFPLTFVGTKGIHGIIATFRDITSQKHMESELARLSNLHLVGEMAASIGHEVRNPMTTVRGFLQMLGDKPGLGEYTDYFQLMISELDRANQIITDFLALAKNKKVTIQQHDLNVIVESLLPLIKADAMNTGHEIIVKLKRLPNVMVDSQEINQLILNLVRNGLEAMPLGGRLTIQTGLRLNQPILTIRDQGIGIPKEVLSKLGTPFFTTKESGTGLGLPVCYSIADRNKAKIEVKTGTKGTAFAVVFSTLPISQR
jgi:PAS domain S-box-containing protein